MECTQYFLHTRNRPDREMIRNSWIRTVVEKPEHEGVQTDGRVQRWARIKEAENRFLRVVLLEDGRTVHNAFFDRSFKGDEK